MSVLGSARLLAAEGEANHTADAFMELEDDTDWVNDVYSQLNGTPNYNVSTRWQRLNKYRLFIGVCSLVLMCLGFAAVVSRSSCLSPILPSMGTACTSITAVSFFFAALLCGTGLLGCVASYGDRQPSMSWCLAFLFLLYAVTCGTGATYVVYSRVRQLDNLHVAWRQLIAVPSSVVCDIQDTLQCSGFEKKQCCRGTPLSEGLAPVHRTSSTVLSPCYYYALNGSTYDLATRREVDWPRTMCLSSCVESNTRYKHTCRGPLASLIKAYFFRLVMVLTALTALFVLLSGTTVAGVLWTPYIDSRMQHRF